MSERIPDFSEVRTRLKEQKERLTKIVLDAKLAHPEQRESASHELEPILRDLSQLTKRLDLYQSAHFVDKDNVITSIGKVGRAIDVDFAIIELKTCMALLERVKESLDFQSLR